MGNNQDVSSPMVFGGCYVKRLTAQLGYGTSPTTCEMELVEGLPSVSEDVSYGATGFQQTALTPGNITGVTLGAFNFAGIVQSWTYNYGTDGFTYNVKLVDPRILFDDIHIIMGYDIFPTGINFSNILHSFGYYGTPSGAGVTPNGVLFSPVRNYITNAGRINLYNKQFQFVFSSGYLDATGLSDPNGIPPWYKIDGNVISLNGLLSKVSEDFSLDYYCYIVPTGNYASTGTISTIYINGIKRHNTVNPTEIDSFITSARSSGTLIGYSRGRELRTDATHVVVSGPPHTFWTSYNTNNGEVLPYWGLAQDGSAIVSEGSVLSNKQAIVLLDHITGSGVNNALNHSSYRVDYTSTTINRNFADSVYPPPSMTISSTTVTTTGYYASENMLRAALFNQESWEAIFYKEDPTAAARIGITNWAFTDRQNFTSPDYIYQFISMRIISPSGRGNRDPFTAALCETVYSAFKETAENFYGKQWFLKSNINNSFYSNNSQWETQGFSSISDFPDLEYSPVDAAWAEVGGYPSGINNHDLLLSYRGETFKDSQGKLKPFVSIKEFQNGGSAFPHPVDMSLLAGQSYFIEQGGKLCLPISVEVYDRKPSRFIVTLNENIQAAAPSGGVLTAYQNLHQYKEFLYAMGFSDADIEEFGLDHNLGDNIEFGLAPARMYTIPSTAQTNGFFIPVQMKTINFGPWTATGSRPAGVSLITDGDLQPSTYGSFDYLNSVGRQTAAKSIAIADIIDFADLNIAGLPLFNIGDPIGDNSNVTSLSISYGIDGLTTNYNLRTFAIPAVLTSKQLQEKITRSQNISNRIRRESVNINKLVKINPAGSLLTTPEKVRGASKRKKTKEDDRKDVGAGIDTAQLVGGSQKANASGIFV